MQLRLDPAFRGHPIHDLSALLNSAQLNNALAVSRRQAIGQIVLRAAAAISRCCVHPIPRLRLRVARKQGAVL